MALDACGAPGSSDARRSIAGVLVAVLLAACGGSSGSSAPVSATPPEGPHVGPLISGTAAYTRGSFVWTDYAYDDRGPNADAANGGDRTQSAFAGGDAEYPAEVAPGNAADLIELQFTVHQNALVIWAVLETLVDPNVPVLAVGFDTDGDGGTGGVSFPGGRWTTSGSLGLEQMVTIAADGAHLFEYADGEWVERGSFDAVVDPETNLMGTTVPPDLLQPGRKVWRAAAALGIASAEGSWLDGAADVFDLAFVGDELLVRWQENRQADILAGALDASEAKHEVDFGRVADGDEDLPVLSVGFHTFLYKSALRLSEGVVRDEQGSPSFLGPYQPYAVYLPAGLPSPSPLVVFLHGSDQNHLGSVFMGADDTYIGTGRALSEDPHLIAQLGYAGDGFDFPPHHLQVLPLARGARLGYRGIAHQDVLDVVQDIERRYEIDEDRVILQGASMGGIGTYRIASLQPDRWSVAFPLIGYQAPALLPLSANLLNIPVRQINGGADPLIPVEPADASAERLDELGYDYRYWLLAERGHEAGGYIWDCLYAGAADYVRQVSPARVVFVVDPSLDVIDPEIGIELRFDSAYWVADVRARGEGLATVDATSHALPRFEESLERIDRMLDNVSSGRDLCGPNPDIQTEDHWRERAIEIDRGAALPIANEIALELANVGSLSIDVVRAGIDPGVEAAFVVSSDGPTSLTLEGAPPGGEAVVAGVSRPVSNDGVVTVDLTGPENRVVLRP
jgi:poly(3-hydroxybutyrate) depolymerase